MRVLILKHYKKSVRSFFLLVCRTLFYAVDFNMLSIQVSGGRNWFLHTIYTVRSESQKNRGVGKRSIEYLAQRKQHATIFVPHHQRFRRELEELKNIGKNRGTNIQMIRLTYEGQAGFGSSSNSNDESVSNGKLPKELGSKGSSGIQKQLSVGSITGIVLAILFLLIVVAVVVIYKRRKPTEKVKRTSSAISVGDQDGTEI